MNPTDLMLARAQIWITVGYLILLFTIIIIFELGHAHLAADELKTFDATLAYLKDAGLVIVSFWFVRSRGGGIPDAGTTMITQSHTSPDGSKTSVTSPAHLPLPELKNPIQPPPAAQ